ncbi:MAG: hypothetical protein NC133_03185 [Prevotella sp.]|nr:hypothetical protein [Prevotella sp.]
MKNNRQPILERKLWITNIGLVLSTISASGKFMFGMLFDRNLCVIAIYTLVLLLAKFECVLGLKSSKRTLPRQNRLIATLLCCASLVYIGCMVKMLLSPASTKTYDLFATCMIAFIAFVEFGCALAGIISKKYQGYYLYRNLKIINFIMALMAILTTQMVILDFTLTQNVTAYNASTGIGIGVVTVFCAIYILVAPRIGVVGHEHQAFYLCVPTQNHLVDTHATTLNLTLCRSWLHGNYVYRAHVHGDTVRGNIVRTPTLWQRIPIVGKIVCCILSEILIFVWLLGRLLFFFRTATVPKRLAKLMSRNGFTALEDTAAEHNLS